jgi:hypothetical protein
VHHGGREVCELSSLLQYGAKGADSYAALNICPREPGLSPADALFDNHIRIEKIT